MARRNSREAKAARRAERVDRDASETRIGVCRGCGSYTECHADSRLCKSCLVTDTEAESQQLWAAEVADMARHKIVV